MASMITAAQWVPRGFAAPFPQKYTLDEAEYERIADLAKLQLEDAEDDLKEAQESGGAKLESGGSDDEVDGKEEKMDVEPSKKQDSQKRYVFNMLRSATVAY